VIEKILRQMPIAIGLMVIALMFVGIASAESAPIVILYSPHGTDTLAGIQNVTWNATDPDGDPLSITIQYYNGTEWIEISEAEINDEKFSWDTRYVPDGSSYLLKVIASDGVLTGEDQSDATFTIDNPLDLTISEIYYKTAGNDFNLEFIELYVYDDGGSDMDTSGWYVTTYDAEGNIALPYISNLDDFDFIVIHMGEGINDTDASDGVATIYLNLASPILDNAGDEVGLYDSLGNIYDFVRYKGGNGDPVLENWQSSDFGISVNTTSESIQVHGADLDDSTNWVSATASEGEANIYEFWLDESANLKVYIHNGIFEEFDDGEDYSLVTFKPKKHKGRAVSKENLTKVQYYAAYTYATYRWFFKLKDPKAVVEGKKLVVHINVIYRKAPPFRYSGSASSTGRISVDIGPNAILSQYEVAHEFMHLVQNNYRTYSNAWDNPLNKFIREGQAIYGGAVVVGKNTKKTPSQIWAEFKKHEKYTLEDHFLPNTDVNIFTSWDTSSWPRGASRYVGSYLFMKYVVDRYGKGKIKDLLVQMAAPNNRRGWAGVEAAIGGGANKKDIFKEWTQWNYLDKKFGATGMYRELDIQASTYTPLWKTYTGGEKVINKDLATASIDTTAKADVHLWAADYVEFGVNTKNPFKISFKGDPTAKFGVTALKIKNGGYEKTVFVNDTNEGLTIMDKPINYKKIVLIIARVSNSDGNYTITIEDLEIEAEVIFDLPYEVLIGEKLDIEGTATAGTYVSVYVDDVLYDQLTNIVMEDDVFSKEVTTTEVGMNLSGLVRLKAWIDCDKAAGEDPPARSPDGEDAILLSKHTLTAYLSVPSVALEDDFRVLGTAKGQQEVTILSVPPKGGGGKSLLDKGQKGLSPRKASVSTTDDTFTKKMQVQEDATTGYYDEYVLCAGMDGVWGMTGEADLEAALEEREGIPSLTEGVITTKTQEDIEDILEDLVYTAGSDDIMVKMRLKVESAYVRLDPVAAVNAGEPLVVTGTSNRQQGFNIVVTCKGPVELEPKVVKIVNDTFTATFDTTAALTGEYTVKADDGHGHTDEVEVFITGKTAQEMEKAVEEAAEEVEEVVEEILATPTPTPEPTPQPPGF
jgi:hypothetical protein